MARTNNHANSAKKETAKKVNNRRAAAAAEKAVAVVDVETIETQAEATAAAVAGLPVVTESGKVSSKEVMKAAGSIRATVKEERRGANVTIRLIAERAALGDAAAVDILCALCDVPRSALYTLNINTVRAAVNAWYPYYMEDGTRRVNVRPVGVWYTTACTNESVEAAAKRVTRGYIAAAVVDYLDQLIFAAKCRAKGITPRRVDAEAVYSDNKLSAAADSITAAEISAAKQRRVYSPGAANVWKKDRNGFYI